MVKRGVWEHDPEVLVARRDLRRKRIRVSLSYQHDWTLWRGQQRLFIRLKAGIFTDPVKIVRHQCQRLFFPALPLPQTHDRIIVFSIHGQVESP